MSGGHKHNKWVAQHTTQDELRAQYRMAGDTSHKKSWVHKPQKKDGMEKRTVRGHSRRAGYTKQRRAGDPKQKKTSGWHKTPKEEPGARNIKGRVGGSKHTNRRAINKGWGNKTRKEGRVAQNTKRRAWGTNTKSLRHNPQAEELKGGGQYTEELKGGGHNTQTEDLKGGGHNTQTEKQGTRNTKRRAGGTKHKKKSRRHETQKLAAQ
jgi:hypothetical protein